MGSAVSSEVVSALSCDNVNICCEFQVLCTLAQLNVVPSKQGLHFAGDGALLGAGVSVLGSIRVGAGTKVGAGSVVVKELPDYCVAVGVPARIIKQLQIRREPSIDMDQCDDFILDYVI